jgi:hypothetical protein
MGHENKVKTRGNKRELAGGKKTGVVIDDDDVSEGQINRHPALVQSCAGVLFFVSHQIRQANKRVVADFFVHGSLCSLLSPDVLSISGG